MSKFKLSLLLVILSVFSVPALAGEAVVKRVPAGAVAFHFVFDLNYITGEFVGYVGFIEGVEAPLFTGAPSKDTAYFTVRITKPTPPPEVLPVEQDPFLTTQLIMPGAQFTVFYDATPGPRDWANPADFSAGVPIAVFEESALMSTQALANFPGVFFNTFLTRLVDSTPINFHDQCLTASRVRTSVTPFDLTHSVRQALPGAVQRLQSVGNCGTSDATVRH